MAKKEHRLHFGKRGLIFFNGEKIKITFANWKIEFSTEIACCKTSLEILLTFINFVKFPARNSETVFAYLKGGKLSNFISRGKSAIFDLLR